MKDLKQKLMEKDPFDMILGQEKVKNELKSALLTDRHVLIVGPPGIGKTTLAKNLASVLGTKNFVRVQGSPDLTAEDLLGDIDPIKALKYGPLSLEAFTKLSYNIPGHSISSLGIVSWLINCFDFSVDADRRHIPKFKKKDQQRGLLRGLIAGAASVHVYDAPNTSSVVFHVGDDNQYLHDLEDLTSSLGYSPDFQEKPNRHLGLYKRDMITLFREGMIINPYHLKKCSKLVTDIVDPNVRMKLDGEQLRLLAFLHASYVAPGDIEQYFGLGKASFPHYMALARNHCYTIHERPAGNRIVRDLHEVLATYDKPLPQNKAK